MSYTFTFTGKESTLTSTVYPPIELDSDAEYVLGLISFEAYNSIPNIEKNKNRFYFGDKVIEIPEGSYELSDINKYVRKVLHDPRDDPVGGKTSTKESNYISITANNNTLKCEVKGNRGINFEPEDSIGSLLGFEPRKLDANVLYESDYPVKILKVNAICVECSITLNSYSNDKLVHILHDFFPTVPPGFKIVEVPTNVIYLPISTRLINVLTIKIVDQDGNLINFRGETITVRLHLKKQNGY